MPDANELTPTHLLFTLIGVGSHLVVGVLVAASGLVAPIWAVLVLMAVWLAGAVVSVVTWQKRMFMPLLMAIATAVAWIALVSFGGAVLGWTA